MAKRELSDFNPWRQVIEEQEREVERLERHARDERAKLITAIERAELWEMEADAVAEQEPGPEGREWFPPAGS